MKKGLITLIFSCIAVAFSIAAVVFGAINMAGDNNLAITSTQMSLASALLVSTIIALVLALLTGKVIKTNSLLALIPNVSIIILGLYAMSNVFVLGQNNNYIVLLILLLIIYVVALIINQTLDFKWATVTSTIAASILLIFFLYDSLAYFTLFDNIFLCLLAFAMLFSYVYTITYTAVSIRGSNNADESDNKDEENNMTSEENVSTEEKVSEEEVVNEDVKEENNVEEDKNEVEENNLQTSNENKEDTTENVVTDENESKEDETSTTTDESSKEDVKETKAEDEPYDNSFMFDEKYN